MLINFSKVKTSVGAKFEVKRPLATGNFRTRENGGGAPEDLIILVDADLRRDSQLLQ